MKTLPTVLLAAAPLVAAGILIGSPAPAVACAAGQSGTAVQATVVGIPGSGAVAVAGLSRYGPGAASAGGRDPAWRGSGSATRPLVVAGAGVGDVQKGTDQGAFTQSIVASSCI